MAKLMIESDNSTRPTEIGPLPADWEVRHLLEICERPQYGFTASASPQSVGPKFLRITDITDEGVDWMSVPYCEIDGEEESKYALRSGDILVARIGATTGKSYLIHTIPRAIFASYLIRIRTKSRILPNFLSLYMQSSIYWQYIGLTKGGRLKQGVNIPVLNELPVPLPSLSEQSRIVETMSAVNGAQQLARETIRLTRDMKKSMMASLLQSEFTPSSDELIVSSSSDIGKIPSHWKIVRIAELFDIQQGKSLSPSAKAGVSPASFLRTANVLWGRIDISKLDQMDFTQGERAALSLQPGDLLVCEGGDIGRTAMWNGEVEHCYYQNHLHRLRAKNEEIIPKFYMYWMDAAFNLFGFYTGQANRTTIPNLSKGRLLEFKVPLPPMQDQKRITNELTIIDEKIAAEESYLDSLNEFYLVTLESLLTGKIRLLQEP